MTRRRSARLLGALARSCCVATAERLLQDDVDDDDAALRFDAIAAADAAGAALGATAPPTLR